VYLVWRWQVESDGTTWVPVAVSKVTAIHNPLIDESLPVRWLNAIVMVGRYLWLFTVPWHLSADYQVGSLPVIRTMVDWRVWMSVTAIIGGFVAAVRCVRRQPIVTWALTFAAVTYAPVSNIVIPAYGLMAERWMYLPSIGFCTVLATAGHALLGRLPGRARRGIAIGVTSTVVLIWGVRTIAASHDWHDYISIWTASLRAVPGSRRAHQGLAHGYYEAGRNAEAVRLLETWLQRNPGDASILAILGAARFELGRREEAFQALREATALEPDSAELRRQLGRLYIRAGAAGDAVAELERARGLGPPSAALWADLGKAYFMDGRINEARAAFAQALTTDPGNADAHTGLAFCAQSDENFSAAVKHYLQAFELGEAPTDNLQGLVETALTAYAADTVSTRDAAAKDAARALRYFPSSAVLRQLANPIRSP